MSNFKERRDAVPKKITNLVVSIVFIVPLILVIGRDNMYDWVLNYMKSLTDERSLIHLGAYLICCLIFMIPAIIILQLIGNYKLKKKSNQLN